MNIKQTVLKVILLRFRKPKTMTFHATVKYFNTQTNKWKINNGYYMNIAEIEESVELWKNREFWKKAQAACKYYDVPNLPSFYLPVLIFWKLLTQESTKKPIRNHRSNCI